MVTLREKFGSDHPRNTARTHGEENDEAKRRNDGHYGHPGHHLLRRKKDIMDMDKKMIFFLEFFYLF